MPTGPALDPEIDDVLKEDALDMPKESYISSVDPAVTPPMKILNDLAEEIVDASA